MIITIITVCFNSGKTIRDTINSVLNQSYKNIEYIIIDGGSTDNTLSIIAEYATRLSYFSQSDYGIYDAMNKGITLAKGDVVGILNADDVFDNLTVLNKVAEVFFDQTIDACYADLLYVKKSNINIIIRYWLSSEYAAGHFARGWTPAHPTFFVKKDVYQRLGKFNLNYPIVADFELMFRFIEINKINVKYIPQIFVRMRIGGKSNKILLNIVKQNLEIFRIIKKQYPKISFFSFILLKTYNKISQFFKRPKYNLS